MANPFSPLAIGAGVLGFLLLWMGWLAGLNTYPTSTGMVVSPDVLTIAGLLLIGFGVVWAAFGPETELPVGGGYGGTGSGDWASDMNSPAYWIWMQTYLPPPDQEAFNRKLAEQAKKP